MESHSATAEPVNRVAEADAMSDDSGVDLRTLAGALTPGSSRKNKRKSSEPRRRREILQMKQFRWESDGSDTEQGFTDRPSSGDSGCIPDPSPTAVDISLSRASTSSLTESRESVIQRLKSKGVRNSRASCSSFDEAGPSGLSVHHYTQRHPAFQQEHQLTGNGISQFNLDGATNKPHEDLCRLEPTPSEEDSIHPALAERFTASQRPRNYKNLSRQRRIEANARERTRVHTISAAFENLRRAVPAYADSQKLSKLAILKIACAYIMALACLNDLDYSREQSRPTFADCVDLCTRTIQAEGRARRRSKD
ncbi:protein atonal homolog 8-like [Limulus polyphemus]|uniref:Protein atonal homolog 8-like n=1 Tax=Limulus polyphemus TaxID=6850 RepID=A0ABM1B1P5_LIMPO|nr:protein atonal homolog 8-like [Limulus polyphemus]